MLAWWVELVSEQRCNDLSEFIQSVVEVAFSSVFVVAVLSYLLKRWIGIRIDESVKHAYARQLEEHKAQLQLENSRQLEELKSNLALENSRQLERARLQGEETTRSRSADLERFEEFLKEYNFEDGSLAYIRDRNMAEPFEWSGLDQFKELSSCWEKASQEFLDSEIEAKRREFCESVQSLIRHLGINAFRLDNHPGHLSQIHPEFKSAEEDWKREKWQNETRLADELAQKVEDSYNDFVRFSRHHLKS